MLYVLCCRYVVVFRAQKLLEVEKKKKKTDFKADTPTANQISLTPHRPSLIALPPSSSPPVRHSRPSFLLDSAPFTLESLHISLVVAQATLIPLID